VCSISSNYHGQTLLSHFSVVLAIDNDEAIGTFRLVDAIADTVGGEVAAKLMTK
jgi:hypothetical protein